MLMGENHMNGIFVNQLGYLPESGKVATMLHAGEFQVLNEKNEEVYRGIVKEFGTDECSGDYVYLADFSELKTEGTYRIKNAEGDVSYSFTVGRDVYETLHHDLLKALYFQRCGCALEEKCAGIYRHACCHSGNTKILEQPEIEKEMSGGWHDAGDFGRYTTPGAVTVGHLLYAFLMFPKSFNMTLQIPESGNGIPDVLNECRYELEWLLKLQREDGAVYHKVSTLHHAGFVMPEDDLEPLYAYPVSSMAVGDFAAVMALGYRVYQTYDVSFAKRMLDASLKAYEWLSLHREFLGFKNPKGTGTGEYGDWSDRDERLWAATELFVATKEERYLADMECLLKENLSLTGFGWAEVSGFASMCALTDRNKTVPEKFLAQFREKVIAQAKQAVEKAAQSGYGVAMKAEAFHWGSNGAIGNTGILLLLAGYLEEKEKYYECALEQLHYLLGRNAIDYSYVTGYGEHAFKHPHNRPTESDGIEAPMPGWVSGGANGKPCDEAAVKLIKAGTPPMKCYVDDWRSYSTNEITIYWNSPFVFLVSAFLRRD